MNILLLLQYLLYDYSRNTVFLGDKLTLLELIIVNRYSPKGEKSFDSYLIYTF